MMGLNPAVQPANHKSYILEGQQITKERRREQQKQKPFARNNNILIIILLFKLQKQNCYCNNIITIFIQ